MPLYFKLFSQIFIPYYNLSFVFVFSSILYLLYKKHIWGFFTLFLSLAIYLSGAASEAYFQQLLPFLIISLGVFLSRLVVNRKQLYIFLVIYILSSSLWLIANDWLMGFSGYGLTLSQKTTLVKQIGFYPATINIIGPGQEFPSITAPYHYLFWYYYRTQSPNTSSVINEYYAPNNVPLLKSEGD